MTEIETNFNNSLLDPKLDMHLYEFPQIFSTSAVWCEKGMENQVATYDLTIRDFPKNRNFMLMGGTEELVQRILDWKYTDEEVKYLLDQEIITKKFAQYMRKFKFTGDIYALPEGTVYFPGEPVVRVTAPLIEGNLITLQVINSITGNTAFMSKFIRSIIAAKGKTVTGPGGLRPHSYEGGMKACRAAYICGLVQIIPQFYRKYDLKMGRMLTIAYHAFIKSFPTEIEAMRSIANIFPYVSLMVDTYDFDQGVKNAITVALELKAKGMQLVGIVLDSGDPYELAVKARKMLDQAGLQSMKITIAANLQEFKIEALMKKRVPADGFVVVTEAMTVPDDPRVESVYKIAQIVNAGKVTNLAKLTPGKSSLPGKKQVFRTYDKAGKLKKDIVGLEDEKLGEPMLVPYIKNGKLVRKLPLIDEIKAYTAEQVSKLPASCLKIEAVPQDRVKVSPKIKSLIEEVRSLHLTHKI